MQIINPNLLFQGKVSESVLVHSFEEYKNKGGKKDAFDTFAAFKERAKQYEGMYISAMDQALSGIDVSDDIIYKLQCQAQVYWYLLHLWFKKPLRRVDYNTFDLNEFNNL